MHTSNTNCSVNTDIHSGAPLSKLLWICKTVMSYWFVATICVLVRLTYLSMKGNSQDIILKRWSVYIMINRLLFMLSELLVVIFVPIEKTLSPSNRLLWLSSSISCIAALVYLYHTRNVVNWRKALQNSVIQCMNVILYTILIQSVFRGFTKAKAMSEADNFFEKRWDDMIDKDPFLLSEINIMHVLLLYASRLKLLCWVVPPLLVLFFIVISVMKTTFGTLKIDLQLRFVLLLAYQFDYGWMHIMLATNIDLYLFDGDGGSLLVSILIACCLLYLHSMQSVRRGKENDLNKEIDLDLADHLASLMNVIPDVNTVAQIEKYCCKYIKSLGASEPFQIPMKSFLVGSSGERLGIALSREWLKIEKNLEEEHPLLTDIDLMMVLDMEGCQSNLTIVTDEMDIQCGYAKIIDSNNLLPSSCYNGKFINALKLKKLLLTSIDALYLKNLFQKCMLEEINILSALHGPAITIYGHSETELKDVSESFDIPNNIFQIDLTISVPCAWPRISDWLLRTNRKWPKYHVVEQVIHNGIHLVPKSSDNDPSFDTWRLSFSSAELQLSKYMNLTSRRCYLGVKTIFKQHIRSIIPALSSYHLKTIFLNTLEETEHEWWCEKNEEVCFLFLLKCLESSIVSRICNHHFISTVNLLESCEISRHQMSCFMKKIDQIKLAPHLYIELPELDYSIIIRL